MPRVVVSRLDELPRELWFGRTGPLERLNLKRSIAKLELAGLRPSWSRVVPLLSYLQRCVEVLGSYATCAAVVGSTRNMIRDACRGRYVPGLDRLLRWGQRLAAHPARLRGLLLTIELPAEGVLSVRASRSERLGLGCVEAAALADSALASPASIDVGDQRRTEPALRRAGGGHGQVAPLATAKGVPALIPPLAKRCPTCGDAVDHPAKPSSASADASFTLGEHAMTEQLQSSEHPPLGEVLMSARRSMSKVGEVLMTARRSVSEVGDVYIGEPAMVGEVLMTAPETLGEGCKTAHTESGCVGECSESAHCRVGEHANCERPGGDDCPDEKSRRTPLRSPPDAPWSMPGVAVVEFRSAGQFVRAGCSDTEAQAQRAVDLLLDASAYAGEPYINRRPYVRERTQEQLEELIEKKLQALASQLGHQKQPDIWSLIMTFVVHLINGVGKHVNGNK